MPNQGGINKATLIYDNLLHITTTRKRGLLVLFAFLSFTILREHDQINVILRKRKIKKLKLHEKPEIYTKFKGMLSEKLGRDQRNFCPYKDYTICED